MRCFPSQHPPFTVPRHDLSSQPKHHYFLQTRSRILPLLERMILSHLRFSPHPTVPSLNQGPIHVRRLGTTMLDCIVPFPFEVPTPYLGWVDLGCQDELSYLHFMESRTAALKFSTNHAICDTNMARASSVSYKYVMHPSFHSRSRLFHLHVFVLCTSNISFYDSKCERL
ncbi:hypothetical protein M405DRAFT_448099 [Rhizopogon salebrosus TDB-379]|nr:hypothetical protein M405DRAFT_448099 [Rhizopogon salebrosus TDB-379]